MTEKKDLLIEIGTEELPPKALSTLITAFADGINAGLTKAKLTHNGIDQYTTPRRLAIIISGLDTQQPVIENNRRGPALAASYDEDGKPTPAAIGFAKSCNVEISELETQKTDKGEWLSYNVKEKGKKTKDLIPDITNQALSRLPIPKRMRWSDNDVEFIRPVHWIVMLLGKEIVPCTILGISASNVTYGHRFHRPGPIKLSEPGNYVKQLREKGQVIANYKERYQKIRELVANEADKYELIAYLDPDLQDEVTSLVEWPVAVTGSFNKEFSELPDEVLVATLQDHQKYFPLKKGDKVTAFVTISNIESKSPEKVKIGNERVIRARLRDAEFFWQRDYSIPLAEYGNGLKDVVFQKELGTLADKTERIKKLSIFLAAELSLDHDIVERAATLAKCDLLTDMVGEFPKLQGTMGRYYALKSNEKEEVAIAIGDHYLPRFAGDRLPSSDFGSVLAIADKLDTLAGLFGSGQQPTGDKDPFGLRRAALGVIRIIIENNISISLYDLVNKAFACFNGQIGDAHTDLESFIFDRLTVYMQSLGYSTSEVDAVISQRPVYINLVPKQLEAVRVFNKLPEAESLVAANKRVVNILKQAEANGESFINTDPEMLKETAERNLFEALQSANDKALTFFDQGDYIEYLNSFAVLKAPVDDFFDSVMVMVDEPELRENRLAMLADLREAMNKVADVSRLQG